MRRRVPALDEIIELRICADALVADEQSGVSAGVRGDQRLGEWNHGVVCGSDAKQDFVVRIIEVECRTQRIGGIIV
jgi:hypothetical protein